MASLSLAIIMLRSVIEILNRCKTPETYIVEDAVAALEKLIWRLNLEKERRVVA